MQTTKVIYSKVFSLGNYENEKIGVEIDIQEGDDVQKAIQEARQFVEFNHKLNGFQSEISHYEYIINNQDEYTGNQVRNAKERIDAINNEIFNGSKLLNK